jgi:hypothetical protein
MAKVTGPLFSMGASGKIGNAMVFFTWKGFNVVREWLKPANPQSAGQGNNRISLGGTGRSVGTIKPDKSFHAQLLALDLIPTGQTKQSYLVQYIIDHYLTTTTLYAAELAALTGHTAYTSWQSAADDLSIVEFDLTYATVAAYNKALGLYLIAKAAIALGFTGAPYTDALSAWTKTDIDAMIADFTGVN